MSENQDSYGGVSKERGGTGEGYDPPAFARANADAARAEGGALRHAEDAGALRTPAASELDIWSGLRQLTDSLDDAIWLCSVDGKRLFHLSAAFERIWGRSAEELYALPACFLDSFLPEDRSIFVHDLEKHAAGTPDSGVQQEYRIVRPDGTIRWILTRHIPVRDADGEVRQIAGMSSDITDWKSAEATRRDLRVRLEMLVTERTNELVASKERLARSEQLLRDVLDSLQIAVGLFDLDGTVLELGRAAIDLTQQSRDSLIGRCWWASEYWSDLVSERQHLLRSFQRACQGELVRVDWTAPVPGIGVRTFDVSFSPLRSARGSVTRVVGAAIDVTERIQAEEKMRLHRDELTHVQRVACLGELASGIAHELNQPLMAIAAYADGLSRAFKAGAVSESMAHDTTTKLVQQSVRAGDIIRRMHGLVRKAPVSRQRVEVDSLVERAMGLIALDARLAEVKLEFHPGGESLSVWGDIVQLEQVTINLLKNAIEAVAAGPARGRNVLVQTYGAGSDLLCIRVNDSGPGVAPGSRAKIFEAFHSTKSHGLGMGLAISRSIVEAHGGRLELDSTVRDGASFVCTLPIGQNR